MRGAKKAVAQDLNPEPLENKGVLHLTTSQT
jgi:hypothetical protein